MRYDFEATGKYKTGRLIDDLLTLRNDRQRRDTVVNEIKEDEAQLAKIVERRLGDEGVVSMAGKRASYKLKEVVVPTVVDWGKFHQFIRKKDALDMLQRRVAVSAYCEYIDDVDDDDNPLRVPGVRSDKITKYTLTAVK